MRVPGRTATAATLIVALAFGAASAASQEVELVVVDPKAVAKGYSAGQLIGETVMNERREPIGTIDDLDRHAGRRRQRCLCGARGG